MEALVDHPVKEIRITLELKQKNVFIHVDDDGDGIPEKDRKRIFEAFTRLDKSRGKQTGGHGLGLAITQKIMFAHKGSISVTDSSLGGWLVLPFVGQRIFDEFQPEKSINQARKL